MRKINQHIIHRINLEVNTGREHLAYSLRANLDNFLNDDLLPKVEILLDRSGESGEIRRFDSINIEIDMNESDSLGDVSNEIIRSLQEKIEAANLEPDEFPDELYREISSGLMDRDSLQQYRHIEKQFIQKARQVNPETNHSDVFIHFLEAGQIPWYGSPLALKEFIASIEMLSESFPDYLLKRLNEVFSINQQALHRFILQMNQPTLEKFILQLGALHHFDIPRKLVSFNQYSLSLARFIEQIVIIKFVNPAYKLSAEVLKQISSKIHSEKQTQTSHTKIMRQIGDLFDLIGLEAEEPFSQGVTASQLLFQFVFPSTKQVPPDQTELKPSTAIPGENIQQKPKTETYKEIYIQNAGLILTHPFLWNFLTNMECTDRKKQLLPDKTSRAIHLLHYLATGEEHEPEFNLTFEKFLCGIPLEMPVDRAINLSVEEKEECNTLLHTIIGYWPALKKTSPDGLRQLFFQRNGKLDLQKFPPKLYVERKAQDILLERLEWNISIVKLPWMNELLFVEW
jgi:hypothetical protein